MNELTDDTIELRASDDFVPDPAGAPLYLFDIHLRHHGSRYHQLPGPVPRPAG